MDGIFTTDQGKVLLEIARKSLKHRFGLGGAPLKPLDKSLAKRLATFVTLKLSGHLRGCIGNLEPVGPLWQGVCDNAINAAFHDHRFSPLTESELVKIHLEISVLSSPRELKYNQLSELPQKLQPGEDGVILRLGGRGATFLPQVWQQLPKPEQFLTQLCLKANLPERIWQEQRLDVQTYHVQYFAEEEV